MGPGVNRRAVVLSVPVETDMLLLLAIAAAPAQDDAAEEIVVWGDLFARWDDTRWVIRTEIGMPYELTLYADQNKELQIREMQVAGVLKCSKDWQRGNHKYEVSCMLEDFALQGAISERNVSEADVTRAQEILDEIDAKLTGAVLQLYVADDGRVTNIDLEGVEKSNRRMSESAETLRQILSRMVVGFHMKMQKFNQLHEGKWHEFNPTVMTMPVPANMTAGATQGSSMLVHQLDRYKGHVVVQSVGKGTTGLQVGESMVLYTLDFTGVSLYDDEEGFMTERVWALTGEPNASAMFQQTNYFHAGRIQLLGSADRPELGPTRPVNGRSQASPLLPAWVPLER